MIRKIGRHRLYLGDCLEKMKLLKNKSVDMILCDLPYGTTACKWDTVIKLDKLWPHYFRVLRDTGALVLFAKEPFASTLRMHDTARYKYDWVWKKSRKNGYVHAKGMPLQETECLVVFSAGAVYSKAKVRMLYNPQGVVPFTAVRTNYVKTTAQYSGGYTVGSTWKQAGFCYPTNIISFKSVSPKIQKHPTQKPVDLLEYLIRTYTNNGMVVLDNTMGSGSTGVACVNTRRRFIGIEKDKGYFNVAKGRISEAEEICKRK